MGCHKLTKEEQKAKYNPNYYEPPYAKGESPLVNAVLVEMVRCINDHKDLTSIDELLRFVPRSNLIQFLPEERWKYYLKKGEKL